MNTFNHIGMLLLSYLALYAAFRSGKAHLEYKKFQNSLDTLHQGSSEISTNNWTKMVIWFGVCIVSIIIVFKIAPTNEVFSRSQSTSSATSK